MGKMQLGRVYCSCLWMAGGRPQLTRSARSMQAAVPARAARRATVSPPPRLPPPPAAAVSHHPAPLTYNHTKQPPAAPGARVAPALPVRVLTSYARSEEDRALFSDALAAALPAAPLDWADALDAVRFAGGVLAGGED